MLDLQDRLAEQVVAKLRIELAGADFARLHIRYTSNPAAYDHYLRGRSLLVNYTEANMLSAIEHFKQALSLDRDYALARAGIAIACAWFSVRYAHLAEEATWAKRADDEAKQALAQEPLLAEAHLAIASAAGTGVRRLGLGRSCSSEPPRRWRSIPCSSSLTWRECGRSITSACSTPRQTKGGLP